MVHIAADLPQFLQRRELAAYEQRLARTAYAYGVDLRRAQWLSGSTVGDPLMRTVDRRWTRLVHGLEDDSLRPQRKAPPTMLLEEIARLIQMLRAPLPTLRILRPEVASSWPAVTPLGTTKGGIHWLVLDLDRVMALPADERTFVLAAGLGHLQCDHGPIFAAHLMAHRGTSTGAPDEDEGTKEGAAKEGGRRPMAAIVRGLLRPWAKVAVFSADRAGLVAVASLPVALRAIERQAAEHVPWMPRFPALETRRRALEDFDKSSLMARRRVLTGDDGGGWAIAPPGREEELDTLTRKIAAAFDGAIRLGGRLAMRIEGYERRGKGDDEASGDADRGPGEAEEGSGDAGRAKSGKREEGSGDAGPGKREEGSERAAKQDEAAASRSSEERAADEPEPRVVDPERASRLEQALRDAWTIARCDQRLTRRLGLL